MSWEDGIGGEELVDIERCLDMMAGAFQTLRQRARRKPTTIRALVQTWAAQSGAAHEDWGQEEIFHVARTTGLHIGDLQGAELQLLQVAIEVRSIGRLTLGLLAS